MSVFLSITPMALSYYPMWPYFLMLPLFIPTEITIKPYAKPLSIPYTKASKAQLSMASLTAAGFSALPAALAGKNRANVLALGVIFFPIGAYVYNRQRLPETIMSEGIVRYREILKFLGKYKLGNLGEKKNQEDLAAVLSQNESPSTLLELSYELKKVQKLFQQAEDAATNVEQIGKALGVDTSDLDVLFYEISINDDHVLQLLNVIDNVLSSLYKKAALMRK